MERRNVASLARDIPEEQDVRAIRFIAEILKGVRRATTRFG